MQLCTTLRQSPLGARERLGRERPRLGVSGGRRGGLPARLAAVPPFKEGEGAASGGGSERQGGVPAPDPVIRRAAEQAARSGGLAPSLEGPAGGAESLQPTQTGLVFQGQGMGEEVAPLVAALDQQLMDPAAEPGRVATRSLARSSYAGNLEAAFNEQINIELTISYVYTAMQAYFNRDDVGLPGFAAFFRHNSLEERTHAELLMNYQSQRGGRVKLLPISPPETEYWHPEKGDALHATELALSLEKLNFSKLRELHNVAAAVGDADATHFLEDYLLHQQSKDVKEASVLVSRVHRAGRGHGVVHLDHLLAEEYGNTDGAIAG
ncbi:hypothetical protein PLESTB_000197600 [Pleodorina starrii]|uniref:Ferritin n=1 Tax=Pleodorina starrii TaxID=330485 RepID=A0A9W6BCJ3_9CHLO|nr:hypothetical protein PLESTM_000334200 [Pleodorina starrii]GLC49238.1 hypothetical protein PLESTB_000197600 [Pleodorina starrii]GLC73509.1 hypothetical protein PLESTF_001385400 [Pleodorina starrii]